MEILIKRKWPRAKYIIGRMFINGSFFCHTMEPPHSAKHPCIPEGTYRVSMYPSAKFKGMRPIVNNVPQRTGILIHEGNYPSNTQGCILVGINDKVGMLSFSKQTLTQLISQINDAPSVHLTIVEDY